LPAKVNSLTIEASRLRAHFLPRAVAETAADKKDPAFAGSSVACLCGGASSLCYPVIVRYPTKLPTWSDPHCFSVFPLALRLPRGACAAVVWI
jgi:hypothetical protein